MYVPAHLSTYLTHPAVQKMPGWWREAPDTYPEVGIGHGFVVGGGLMSAAASAQCLPNSPLHPSQRPVISSFDDCGPKSTSARIRESTYATELTARHEPPPAPHPPLTRPSSLGPSYSWVTYTTYVPLSLLTASSTGQLQSVHDCLDHARHPSSDIAVSPFYLFPSWKMRPAW